jgi:alpha-D-ribose 1-methylphosphonate 5-triphosphate synthase subunit PhnG
MNSCIDNVEATMSTLQFDGRRTSQTVTARQAWMQLLSRAPLDILEPALAVLAGPQPQWLRPPETGLIMTQGRVGGTGARFNLGEVTVTRCALRTDPAVVACNAVGVAYVLGRSHRHAELAATADALLQDPACRELLPDLMTQIEDWLEIQRAARASKARATKVEFFTVAREAGGAATATEDIE